MAGGSGLTRGEVSLTHRSIDALRPTGRRIGYPISVALGWRCASPPSGIKTWDLAYRIRGSGKARRVSLGRVGDVSLERARERANELTSAARGGRDLIAEEEESRAAAASQAHGRKAYRTLRSTQGYRPSADSKGNRAALRTDALSNSAPVRQ